MSTTAVLTSNNAGGRLAAAALAALDRGRPPAVDERARDILLDTIAAIVSGGRGEPVQRLAAALDDEGGGCTDLVSRGATTLLNAVLINAASGNSYLESEGHRIAGGHPAVHLVPVSLASAEHYERALTDLLDGLVIGYEIAVRTAMVMGRMSAGLHPNGSWSSVGCAAAFAVTAATGKGVTPEMIHAAVEMAAATAISGPDTLGKAGVSGYNLLSGTGATTGAIAGRAALAGWEGLPGSVEDFFLPRFAGQRADPSQLSDAPALQVPWSSYEITNNYFKRFPTCAHTQCAIDASLLLRDTFQARRPELERISVRAVQATALLDDADPPSLLGCRYSVPIACAVALIHGLTGVVDFGPQEVDDPAVRDLAHLVEIEHDTQFDARYRGTRATAITLHFSDGSTEERFAEVPAGDAANPLPREEIHERAIRLLSRRYAPERANDIAQWIQHADASAPARDLSRLLAAK